MVSFGELHLAATGTGGPAGIGSEAMLAVLTPDHCPPLLHVIGTRTPSPDSFVNIYDVREAVKKPKW